MTSGWDELTGLTGGKAFTISRVEITDADIAIEGNFELPPLAQLSYNDQVFVAMFVRFHGSIKQMEAAFGISYPTVKARLNKISEQLAFVDVLSVSPREVVLDLLERGEITADEAAERLT
jgi:hypothetical protein